MSDQLNAAVSAAQHAENIGAKLSASAAFTSALGSPNGNTDLGASEDAAAATENAEQPEAEGLPASAAAEATEPPKHVVPGLGGVPEHIAAPKKSPYEQLRNLIVPGAFRTN